jgi:hypothetical protein
MTRLAIIKALDKALKFTHTSINRLIYDYIDTNGMIF